MSQDKTEETTSKNDLEVEEVNVEETTKNEESTEEDVVDYKAELKKEKVAREKAESDRDNYKKGMLKAKKSKKKKADDFDEFEDDEDEIDQEELINKRVDSVVKGQSRKIANQLRASRVDEMLDEATDSDDEKALIKFHLEHTINPSGNLKKDIQDCKLIANRKALLTENNELKLSLKAKNSIRNSSVGSGVNTTNKATREDKETKKLHMDARVSGDMRDWSKVIDARIKPNKQG